MRDFNNFIDDMEFMDFELMRRSFTWSNSQVNEKWSRIDRFLLHSEWLDRFNLKEWGLARTLSDHCPILLMEDERDWGPKPSRFFNAWLENKECLIIMENAWRVNHKHRWAAVRICMKLKGMKEALKIWAKEAFGNIQKKLDMVELDIHNLDIQAEEGNLSEADISQRRALKAEMWSLSRSLERMWMQKSRINWQLTGDKNSNFFSHYGIC